jgi:putative heme-binding domain-containing protein
LSAGDPALAEQLAEVWGEFRVTAADRRERISELKGRLDRAVIARGDLPRGRTIFDKVCGTCHKLYGNGGEIGPDLTGSGRDNLEYLLENIVDPSAVVTADFRMVVVAMKDGRILNGIVKRQTEKSLTLQTQTEAVVINRSEIEGQKPSTSSLMPDGLLDTLSETEIRDLIAYLAHQTQVPLPASAAVEQRAGMGP